MKISCIFSTLNATLRGQKTTVHKNRYERSPSKSEVGCVFPETHFSKTLH
jgi:hypothetical protein